MGRRVQSNLIPLELITESAIDPKEHYRRQVGPIEHQEVDECEIDIKNIGWTLGNDCPYRCKHCYSMSAREKGMNLSIEIIDRVVNQLKKNGVKTVNLGGNEPLFTNGLNPKDTLLPYVIDRLTGKGITVGLTTSGITLIHLERDHKDSFLKLSDMDVSLDSPFNEEHNNNRGANLYSQALRSLELCQENNIAHTIIMCAMNWNFTERHIRELVRLALKYDSYIRINALRPVDPKHMFFALTPQQYYRGFSLLMSMTNQVDLGEPPLAAVTNYEHSKGCPCGRTSLRIHSVTPDGKIPVSPCVYLHDYKVGDLIKDELYDIVRSPQFQTLRKRNANPHLIPGCEGCPIIDKCRGGCAARSYLYRLHETGQRTLFVKDPYCPIEIQPDQNAFPQKPRIQGGVKLVHKNYLCTWIGKPNK